MIKTKFDILIVDDDPQIVDLILMFLHMNYQGKLNCVSASDAQTALMKLSNQEFDIIILDLKMPGRTGVELVTHLKKSLKFAKIPIILMSGALTQNDAIKAIESGVRDILVKPFNMKQLISKIQLYLDLEKGPE